MIVVALPTIPERGEAWKEMADHWYGRTPGEAIICVPSWRKGGWCDGLNEVWEQHRDAEVFVCGSDDMYPAHEGWLEAVRPYLEQGCVAPQVIDPRFARFDDSVQDGSPTHMSSFPILGGWLLDKVFPLPSGLHYYGDNLISDRLAEAGIPTIAVPSCVIVHGFDERGRGAGMGSETERMAYDRKTYKRLLAGS